MKRILYPVILSLIAIASCTDDETRIFDKTADERAAAAIAALKQDLVAPANGWIIRYNPEEGSGSYYVLMKFQNNGKVLIKTDLGAADGEYIENTISYRIDNSLGLELILENYSFFSFLFEQDQATFGAEYEFDYVNKTPDNALVFRSKTDLGQKGIILFRPASATDEDLLGVSLSSNLNLIAGDLDKFASSVRLTYDNRNLALYLSLDELRRTLTITSASLKSNTATTQTINFSTPYIIEGDRIVFDEPFTGTIFGSAVSIESIRLNTIGESTIDICADPIPIHNLSGTTSAGDDVFLETSLIDVSGRSFASVSDFYFAPLIYIFNNGVSMGEQIAEDVAGALEMHLYYGLPLGNGELLYGIGLVIRNLDGSITFALREFNPVLNNNNLVFNFADEITLFGNPTTDANVDNIHTYLDALSEGDNTYIFQLQQNLYEFYNPCTGWSFVFINANQ